MSLTIWIQVPHPLTTTAALEIRRDYDDSSPEDISGDIVAWQRGRYLTDLTREDFNVGIDAHRLLDILTQMLWERKRYGLPWRPVDGDVVPLSAGS